ncbi:hypothetical protein [Variovorax rhizosphaerae]|uniref:Uncharacterized protein n=1 Tax=Variovorax rhizosphaerae TaxID=1836200 RepID=A0ABU8WYK2_9BURK
MDSFFAFIAKAAPLLTFISTLIAASVAAGVTIYFGRVQAGIARQQAKTAAMAAATARNKLRLDLFEKRLNVPPRQNSCRCAGRPARSRWCKSTAMKE